MSTNDFEDYVEEEPRTSSRDIVIDAAKAAIEAYFEDRPAHVSYHKEIQVHFEKKFFHWITGKAIRELIEEGRIKQETRRLHKEATGEITPVKFLFHRRLRYPKRQIALKLQLVRDFSDEQIGRASGRYAELLFSNALLMKGFSLVSQNATEYKGRRWHGTGHNLDYVFEKDGVAYGIEIKNRFEYIERDELIPKIDMCQSLGLRPLFIFRACPKTYNNLIIRSGGFVKIFEQHIYPYATSDNLLQRIRNAFPSLNVGAPRELPATILDRFLDWHNRHGGQSS